jgi:diguanylate cyclase (GGDEF)-like protein
MDALFTLKGMMIVLAVGTALIGISAFVKNLKSRKTTGGFLSAQTAKSRKSAVELIRSQFEIEPLPDRDVCIDSLSGVNTRIMKLNLSVQLQNPSEHSIFIEQVKWELWLGSVVQAFTTYPRIKVKGKNRTANFSTQESMLDQNYLKLIRAEKSAEQKTGYVEAIAVCVTDFGKFDKKFVAFNIPYEVRGTLGSMVEGARPETPSNIDSLTGLLQRKFIEENFQTIIDTVAQHKPISLIMFDIDHFKKFNDTYGHLIGDEILKTVGAKIKEVVSEKGLGIRYGGDEFIVILEGVDSDEAEKIAKKLHKAVGDVSLKVPQGNLHITLSIGVAVCRSPVSYLDLIKMTDKALYESKGKGRNQVTADHTGVL